MVRAAQISHQHLANFTHENEMSLGFAMNMEGKIVTRLIFTSHFNFP